MQEINLKIEDLATSTPETAWQQGSFISRFFTALKNKLLAWFADTANGITDFFAKVIHSDRVQTRELCVGATCITETQLAAVLSATSQTPAAPSAQGDDAPEPAPAPASTEPALIETSTSPDSTTSTSSEQAASPQAEAVPAPPLAPELLPTAPDSSPIAPDQLAGQSDPSTSEPIPVSQ